MAKILSRAGSRGALIVFEGCDRCGKTTQCQKLVDALKSQGIPTLQWRFPDRETAIGKVINDYLQKKCELEDHAVHLLFAANRWEAVPKMMELLKSGTTLVVDRYSYSGVAFTGAKQEIDLRWCQGPEIGLPKPDAVLYMTLSSEEAEKRGDYGEERYEEANFQKIVAQNFKQISDQDWITIHANKSIEDLHKEIMDIAKKIISNVNDKEVSKLWTDVNKQG